MAKIVLVSFDVECGRQGEVSGLFVCDQDRLESLYGQTAYFGEILGKHSEVIIDIEADQFTIKSEDVDFITKLVALLSPHISGYSPFDHMPIAYGCSSALSAESKLQLGITT